MVHVWRIESIIETLNGTGPWHSSLLVTKFDFIQRLIMGQLLEHSMALLKCCYWIVTSLSNDCHWQVQYIRDIWSTEPTGGILCCILWYLTRIHYIYLRSNSISWISIFFYLKHSVCQIELSLQVTVISRALGVQYFNANKNQKHPGNQNWPSQTYILGKKTFIFIPKHFWKVPVF
jgi:hypothetical protein